MYLGTMHHSIVKLTRMRNMRALQVLHYSVISDMIKVRSTDEDAIIDSKIKNIKDKLLYSDYLEKNRLHFGFKENYKIKRKLDYRFQQEKILADHNTPTLSIALKYLDDKIEDLPSETANHDSDDEEVKHKEKPIYMPYAAIDKFKQMQTKTFEHISDESMPVINEKYKLLYEKYLKLSKSTDSSDAKSVDNKFTNNELELRLEDDFSNIPSSWMTDYEIFDDSLQESIEDVRYGTPNPDIEVSSVPCGGCGALLHCKDVAIPGYLPSELFLNKSNQDLLSITCQRCHFMKHYNTCLDVKVSADEYPKLLEQIKHNPNAAVLLLVDLTDFPCSIWPGLPSLVGQKRHVYIVGNKIDLLPPDSSQFLVHVKDCLTESLIKTGIVQTNIKHIGLISAKTGFGVDELINKLNNQWQYKSDIYLVGCTNAGKSTLFNTLLHSDFCKSQAVDLVQRATTSQWPGTTLNVLKFPILKPTGKRLFLRSQGLKQQMKENHAETYHRELEFRKTKNIELVTLQSCINNSFKASLDMQKALEKSNDIGVATIDKEQKFGLDETSLDYKHSRWFYDTPGTIQPDQTLNFLTTNELMKTLPRKIISPRTFCIWPGQTLFIAGMGRLDILNAYNFLRCTVFASKELPITICKTENAALVYNELLQTEAFVVPINSPDRLKMWPKLKSKVLETVGIGYRESVSDVVLSSAGWISITPKEEDKVTMEAWTLEGRGIYLRTPALLSKSVTHRGMRRVGSPAYRLGRQVYLSKRTQKSF